MKRNVIKKTGQDQRGVVMLLALLVLSVITAVAISLSVIIIKDVRASSSLDRSMVAYYAAETGTEFGLNQVKESRKAGETLAQTLVHFDFVPPAFGNGGRWSVADSDTSEDFTLTFLPENQTVVLDLYDPNSPLGVGAYESFWVEGLDAHPEEDPAWMEISYFPWDVQAGIGISWDDTKVTKRLRSIYETDPDSPAGFDEINGSHNYRIRIKALYDDLKNVRITAYNVDNPFADCDPVTDCIVQVPNRVMIKSIGTSGSNRVGLTASVPWQIPSAAIFDYVLFSEERLDKRT